MKKYISLLLVAIAVLATSCNKQNVNEPEQLVAGEGQFLATIAENSVQNAPSFSGADNSTKAAFNGNNVMWQVSDEILVNGTTFTCSRTQTNQAVFDNQTAQVSSPYHAFYPATITNVNGNSGSLVFFFFFFCLCLGLVLGLYATSTTNTLTFHNICAALKITLPAGFTASKIEISNLDKAINGAFTVSNDVAVMHTTNVTDDEKKITITGTFTGGEVIYAPLPAGTYTNFTVRMLDASNNQTWFKTIQTLTVAANKIYNVRIDKDDYFCFTAKAANSSVIITRNSSAPVCTLQCKTIINGTESAWSSEFQTSTTGTTIQLPNAGDKVYFRAGGLGNASFSDVNQSVDNNLSLSNIFTGTGNLEVSGNIMYLLSQNPTTTLTNNAFSFLFYMNTVLTDASKLVLPATTLTDHCYYRMFSHCHTLTKAPALPATMLATNCYKFMFNCCYELSTAPILPATVLANDCYNMMFEKCYKMSSVTIKATSIGVNSLNGWLTGAGTESGVANTIYVANDNMVNWFNTNSTYKYGWSVQKAQ